MVSGILGTPWSPSPPRLTVFPLCWLKRLITVRVENPVPLTVIVAPDCVTEVTVIAAPIGTDTALLLLLKPLSAPLLITTTEPGPVGTAAGRGKLNEVDVSPGPGSTINGPTLPPVQAQKTLTATPLVASNPVPPKVTAVPCSTMVSTLLTA